MRLIGATVSKEVSPTEGTIGSELTYTLHMNLPPEIKFFNTTMVDTLPNGVAFDATGRSKPNASKAAALAVDRRRNGTRT